MNQYDDNTNIKAKEVAYQHANDLERIHQSSTLQHAIDSGHLTHISIAFARCYITSLVFEHTWRKCTKQHDTWIQFNEMKKILVDENFSDSAKININTRVENFIRNEAGGSGVIRNAIAQTNNKPTICNL